MNTAIRDALQALAVAAAKYGVVAARAGADVRWAAVVDRLRDVRGLIETATEHAEEQAALAAENAGGRS